jgi:hypothetical protein
MTSTFKIGDPVVFGRPSGEQTHGVVLKVNGKTILIEQTEARGQGRVRQAGAKWRVAVSLVRHQDPNHVSAAPVEKPRRSRAEIQAEIDRVESQLSPENLFWDGERPRGQALKAGRALNRRLRELEQELRAQ